MKSEDVLMGDVFAVCKRKHGEQVHLIIAISWAMGSQISENWKLDSIELEKKLVIAFCGKNC